MRKLGIFCSLFNAEEYLDGYLWDMMNQSIFEDVSFYFLDCASTDNSYKKIEPYSSYENVHTKRLEKDPSLYGGWNHCIDWIEEDIIGNWNADDRKNRKSLEILLKAINKDPEVDLVYGKTLVSRKKNEKFSDIKYHEVYPCLPHSFENLLRNNSPHCMPIWRKKIHEKSGYFDETLKTAADTDMWLRACRDGSKMKMVDNIVGVYYDNPKGRSSNPETLKEMVDEVFKVRRKYL
jgi:glycosyltransferase involved in cell wall biosynthesis